MMQVKERNRNTLTKEFPGIYVGWWPQYKEKQQQEKEAKEYSRVFMCYLLFALVTSHPSHRPFFMSTSLLYIESGDIIQ